MSSELHDLPARELAALYSEGKLSPVEVTRAVLAQIERWEPHLQATWLLRAFSNSSLKRGDW